MSDYLWDGSGEPDAELDRLQSVLRPLRFVAPAEPLRLPIEDLDVAKRRPALWRWAVAAVVLFTALGLGAWMIFQPPAQTIAMTSPGAIPSAELGWTIPDQPTGPEVRGNDSPAPSNSAPSRRAIRTSAANQAASRARTEAREGRMAADQLLKALRITSDQLNFVRTKVSTDGRPDPAS
jgi:hypothetical protein